jgi:hypothetical protein
MLNEFWAQMHTRLTYLHGTLSLGAVGRGSSNIVDDLLQFLELCSDEHFLDFVEFVFQIDASQNVHNKDGLVADFNEFLRVDDLPYALTGFVWTKEIVERHGRDVESHRLTAIPQVIRRDSEHLHAAVTEPVLGLLRDARFSAANAEFLAALADYRHGRYGDALTKSGSAFESVLKVICHSRGWPYKSTDTAAPMITTVVRESGLEGFFEQPFLLIATMRNRLSTAHGGGTAPRDVSATRVEYVLNASASAILFLVRETA